MGYTEDSYLTEVLTLTHDQAELNRFCVGIWSEDQWEAFCWVWARNKAFSSYAERWRNGEPSGPEVVRLIAAIDSRLSGN